MAGGEPRLGTTATYMRHNDHGTTRPSTEIDRLHDLLDNEYRVFSAGSVRKWSKFGLAAGPRRQFKRWAQNEICRHNGLSSPPRKRGSRARATILPPLDSRFRGNDDKKRQLAVSAVGPGLLLLHLARAGTRRIGLPARGTGLGHQALQRLCFAVEHRARFLAAQHDELERVHEHLVELAAALPEADRQQRGQRILRRLHLF